MSGTYNIIELHPGECRSGSRIKQRIGEACSSKRIHLEGGSPDFFGKTKANPTSKRALHADDGNKKSTLIHIEHPEIACAEDTNFYCTLGNMCRRSKVPIVITTNDLDFVLDSLDVPESAKLIECKRPSIDYCVYRVLLIFVAIASSQSLSKPRLSIDSSVHEEDLVLVVEELVKSHEFDLRKLLYNLASHAALKHPLPGPKHLSPRANKEESLTSRPTILSLVPPVLSTMGGQVTIRYSGIAETENICVYLNDEPVAFQKRGVGLILMEVPPCAVSRKHCSRGEDSCHRRRNITRYASVCVFYVHLLTRLLNWIVEPL